MTELEFISLIKEKRDKRNISQKELSKLTFIPQVTLCKIENGYQKLTFEQIRTLSIILDIDLNLIKQERKKSHNYYD